MLENDDLLREKNFEVVKFFMEQKGPERNIARNPLFTEDAIVDIFFTPEMKPRLMPAVEWSNKAVVTFPNWSYPDNEFFMTQHPDKFFVYAHSVGKMGDRPHESWYYIYFEMEDGKIKLYREIYNPVGELKNKK